MAMIGVRTGGGGGRRYLGGRRQLYNYYNNNSSNNSIWKRLGRWRSSRNFFRGIIISLAFIALLPPLFFHFRLRRFHQIRLRECGWLNDPPLVCAHGGDSTHAFPNTMAAYHASLSSQVDCIEIDVSRSSDGVLFALHDRDLQQISGNSSSKVGHLSMKEIKELGMLHKSLPEFKDQKISTIEEALMLVSSSVRRVILDAKVGPPAYEKGLARDILSVVQKVQCNNCLVWAKSDSLVRDMLKLPAEILVGYIVMRDPYTGVRMNPLRVKGAQVAGVYHPLIDDKLVRILHGRNKSVYAWTVDDEDSMKKMLLARVDAVVTNKPTVLQRLIQDVRTRCREEGSLPQ